MAKITPYKQRDRRDRRAVIDSDFTHGMMFSTGTVDEGYLKNLVNFTYDKDGSKLIPRPSLHPDTIVFPDMSFETSEDYLSDSVTIKDAKECIEDGVAYSQFIFGKLEDDRETLGDIWVATSRPATETSSVEVDDTYEYDIKYSIGENSINSHRCYFYTSESSDIHGIRIEDDEYRRMKFPVGTFAYGNSYYFFGEEYNEVTEEWEPGLFKTKFDNAHLPNKYVFEKVEPKALTASEAVTYGYNMLLREGKAYVFNDAHQAATLQFQGILPYDAFDNTKLLMTPKKNQPVTFRCYYDVVDNHKYDIIWEWRETTASDWTVLQHDVGVEPAAGVELKVEGFRPPAVDMMVRVSAYRYDEHDVLSDIVEKAMTVGFDFTIENYGTATALEQENYDLSTATGMEAWKDRLVVWGLPKDPTILFISDYNEPSYFPYPNNITVFDNPIIYAVEFMDGLAVFTTDKLYYVTLNEDGNSWKTELLQSHLHIDPWDKHLIQTVRNMLYFKSGNYYYMMVPKAQSTTGELTLAPITTPITSFFDSFSVNVQDILTNTFDYTDDYYLISYYNFLDYEDIHNIYVYKFDDSLSLLYVDIMYNTVDRTWKVWVYENANMLFPFRNNATASGLLAASSVLRAVDMQDDQSVTPRRFIQLFKFDKVIVRDFYIPKFTEIIYDTNYESATFYNNTLTIPNNFDDVEVDGVTLVLPFRMAAKVRDTTLLLSDLSDYYYGFYKSNIDKTIHDTYARIDEYYTFKNYQYIDTGYRDDEIQSKKRYRELQLSINNLDQKTMQFGMEYILDGSPRKIYYKYDPVQAIDEFNPDYGVIYVDSTPFLETEISDLDLTNQWTLDQGLRPEVTLWKIRVAISGKGYAPRLKLLSRNEKRFELLSINWILKMMHMR